MRPGALGYTVRRAALTAGAVTAFAAAAVATTAALEGNPDAGVVVAPNMARITMSSPAGFSWGDGIRAGQEVVEFHSGLEPGGWRLVVEAGGVRRTTSAVIAESALRATLPIAVGALLAAGLAVVFLRTNRRWVVPLNVIALVGAAVPLRLLGDPQLSTLGMVAAVIAPWSWLLSRPRRPWTRAAAALGAVAIGICLGGWLAARVNADETYDAFELLRRNIALAGALLVVGGFTVIPVLRREPIRLTRPALVDVAFLAFVAGAALLLTYLLLLPPLLVWPLAFVSLFVVPAVRRRLGARVGGALLADLRREAAEEAFEEERARMARELHDVPLQELAGVIRRLELLPEARVESEQLRRVAAQLRAVATDLRPPVLDDLGLPAALDFLAETASTADVPVIAHVEDATGLEPAARPPEAVELAAFRIAQEAVANAVRHSTARHIEIRAAVSPELVDLAVVDDGLGIAAEAVRKAGRTGRLGLASMRRRAEAIDADLSIDGSKAGTVVRLTWRR